MIENIYYSLSCWTRCHLGINTKQLVCVRFRIVPTERNEGHYQTLPLYTVRLIDTYPAVIGLQRLLIFPLPRLVCV